MQHRMKTNQLTEKEILNLLKVTEIGALATINAVGTNTNASPYVLPFHFIYLNEKLYLHGLPKGHKIDNIKANPKVSFCLYKMEGFLLDADEKPCDTNTAYQSIVINGEAKILTEVELKTLILKEIIKKYTPQLIDKPLPENMLKGTAVIEITIEQMSGKFYK